MSRSILKLTTTYNPILTTSLKRITAGAVHQTTMITPPSTILMIHSGRPEFPAKPPEIKPHTPTELPITPNFPDFGPVPPEEFPDPKLEPASPDFPVPPTPSPAVPDAPEPPMPSPPGPDIPLGPPPSNDPDVIPMGPPEVEPMPSSPPGISTPTMG